MKLSRKNLERLFTALPIVIALLVLVLSGNLFLRQDLTSDGAYTISSFTKSLIRGLEHPVEVTYFLSDKLLVRDLEVQRDLDLLREMEAVDPSKFRLRVLDPESLGPQDQSPEAVGIQPQSYQIVENDQTSFARVYTGAILTYLDDHRLMPLIYDSSMLEYDIARNLQSLTGGIEQKVGILYGSEQLSQQSRYLEQDLSRIARPVRVLPGDDIPADISALFVLGHSELSAADAYRIDQYVMRGGAVFVTADYHHVDLTTGIVPVEGTQTPMLELLEAWGFRVEPSWVLDPRNQQIPVQQQAGRIVYTELAAYPLWPRLGSADGNDAAPITSSFSGLDLYWASPITLTASDWESSGYTALVRSSSSANSLVAPLQVDPRALIPNGEPPAEGQGYVLAASFEGTLQSGFAGREEAGLDSSFIPQSAGPVRVVVLADEDALSDLMDIDRQNSLRNLIFSKNTFEWLSRQEDLLKMRTRQVTNQRLDRIQDPVMRGAMSSQAKFWGLILGPLVFVIIGVARFLRRRQYALLAQAAGAGGVQASNSVVPGRAAAGRKSGGRPASRGRSAKSESSESKGDKK